MTLFKQLAIILSIFSIIVMSIVFIINFESANNSLQNRLYEDAKNTASSLSLSLNTAKGDISLISTMINANFDSGNYKKISLISIDKSIIYQRVSEIKPADVPEWFLKFVKIDTPTATANVMSNWNQVGTLYVQSNSAYAYSELYKIVKNLFISLSILTLIVMIVLNLIIMKILKPLKKLQYQAEAIMRNEFIVQDELPYTTELRDVINAMNNMVTKVKSMFEYSKEILKHQKELEYVDRLTKLKNRRYFIDKLPEYLKVDASFADGVAILIAINGVTFANEKFGRKHINRLFKELANILNIHSKEYDHTLLARINATEFIIILPLLKKQRALEFTKSLKEATDLLFEEFNLDLDTTYLSFGIYEYNHKQTTAEFLASCDNALMQAKLSKDNIFLDTTNNNLDISRESWKQILTYALQKDKIDVISWRVIDSKDLKIEHFLFSLHLKCEKEEYSYGQFMAQANHIAFSNKIYSKVINKILTTPNRQFSNSSYALRLSKEYLEDLQTYDELKNMLELYAMSLRFNLIFEIPDLFVHRNLEQMKKYAQLFRKYDIDIGIYEFICEGNDYQYLETIKPLYIKGDSSYFIKKDIKALSALRLITDTLEIKLIATGVVDKNMLKSLQQRGIYIVQGSVVELL